MFSVGIDIGGTCTDCAVCDDSGRMYIGKALSTPGDWVSGIYSALRIVAENAGLQDEHELLKNTALFFHATTTGENALFTRSGSRVALITTRGFRSTFQIMRGRTTDGLSRSEARHLAALDKPASPAELILEVSERIDSRGEVILPLGDHDISNVVDRIRNTGIESVAICLLWSFRNPAHEELLAAEIAKRLPKVFVTKSCDVAPYLGEYERTATTVVSAYIRPALADYLSELESRLRISGLSRPPLIMQAYGGVVDAEVAKGSPVGVIESGPVAGVIGTSYLSKKLEVSNVIATDMGGTTFKVGIIRDQKIERDFNPVIDRFSLLTPKIWMHSISAGAGSVVWFDRELKRLKVGPRGAGSNPGPACYGVGGIEPTVTDVDLYLGYLNPLAFLGGRLKLDQQAAADALNTIADQLDATTLDVAVGAYEIVNAQMASSIKRATVERGYDPKTFTLVAFGGAGPLHACAYARELGISNVIVPATSSVLGAAGLLCTDVIFERGCSLRLGYPYDVRRLSTEFESVCGNLASTLNQYGFDVGDYRIELSIDLRFRFQSNEFTVILPETRSPIAEDSVIQAVSQFVERYNEEYGPGAAAPEAGIEIVSLHVRGIGELVRPVLDGRPSGMGWVARVTGDSTRQQRQVYLPSLGDYVEIPIFDGHCLEPGEQLLGPSIIETAVTTIVVPDGDSCVMDELGNFHLKINQAATPTSSEFIQEVPSAPREL